MSTVVNGTSVITAGLDHWFHADDTTNLYPDEFRVDDWRLQERLRVRQLRLPPHYRTPRLGAGAQRNIRLSVPALRFPQWSFCIYCKRLTPSPLSEADLVRCDDRQHEQRKTRRPVMSQVPFVIICERGHLDDFPWREWTHGSLQPACQGTLRLFSRGGGSLAGQVVKCDSCGSERTLEGITSAHGGERPEETTLSHRLSSGERFACSGSRPWVADNGPGCGWPVRAALRGASNVYFPLVESSIFLPRQQGNATAEVLEVLRRPDIQPRLQILHELGGAVSAEKLREHAPEELLRPFSDAELQAGLDELLGVGQGPDPQPPGDGEELTPTADWRRPEYELLRQEPRSADLVATDPGVPATYENRIGRVRRVEVLRETRALRGFTRVRYGRLRLSEGKSLLRRRPLPPPQDWLPAYTVRGEGIYLELEPAAVGAWESHSGVQLRAGLLAERFQTVQRRRGLQPQEVTPRLILIHTFAHLLINELVYMCGYSSASLRERLYVPAEPSAQAAAVLIYTAAGDSEGTMGGLVRMADPDALGTVISSAVRKARWCSTDPVCMELGEAGQGPDSCNMAACHGCVLVPETSCEEFNRFLDRGLVIGTFDQPDLGFFADAGTAAREAR